MNKNKKTARGATPVSDNGGGQRIKTQWQFNRPLLLKSLLVGAMFALATSFAYWYQRADLPAVISDKAEQAKKDNDFEQQIVWLSQFLELKPDSLDTILELAYASDSAADAPPANRADKVIRARRFLIAALGAATKNEGTQSDSVDDLRTRLITRESQFGKKYANDVLKQVITLNPAPDNVSMLKAFAFARNSTSSGSSSDAISRTSLGEGDLTTLKQNSYWEWLRQQPAAIALALAWRADPDDVRLASALLSSHVENPAFVEDQLRPEDPEVLADITKHLASLTTNGLAQQALLTYQIQTRSENASGLVDSAGLNAYKRLLVAESETTPLSTTVTPETLPSLEIPKGYNPQADFRLALTWLLSPARLNESVKEGTKKQLDKLLALEKLRIRPALVEAAFLARTKLVSNGDDAALREILDEGIARLKNNSLSLQVIRSNILSRAGAPEDAENSLKLLKETISRRKRLLANAGDTAEQQTWKSGEQSALTAAEWEIGVMNAYLAERRGDLDNALRYLTRAREAQFVISKESRLNATLLRAAIYQQLELWDKVASTYEEATAFNPGANEYLIAAANAWELAGHTTKSAEIWQTISPDTVPLAFRQLQALINEQLLKPEIERDFSDIRQRGDAFEEALAALPSTQKKIKEQYQTKTRLLKLRMPDPKDGQTRVSKLDRLVQLAEEFPDDANLLATTAIALAKSKKANAAKRYLLKLADRDGEDSPLYITTTAQLEALQGRSDTAIDLMTTAAKSQPENATRYRDLAVEIALTSGAPMKAYKILSEALPSQLTPQALHRRFTIALDDYRTNPETQFNEQQLAAQCDDIRAIEGDNGTWWKLAKATLAVFAANKSARGSKDRDTKIKLANALANQIIGIRPRWGLAQTLRADIAEASGDNQTAATLLKAGITNGDNRVSTAARLTQLLIKLNRIDEAENEYRRFERLKTIDPKIASLGIFLASEGMGSKEGLELARQNAAAHDRDEYAWLLLAQTAVMAARKAKQTLARESLLQEVKEALDTALTLSDDSSTNVYQSRLRFQSEFFGREGVRRELSRIAESKIAEPARSLILGLTYLQIKDMKESLRFLNSAVEKAPDQPRTYIALADYYQTAGNEQKYIEMLERAVQLAPQESALKGRLAIALSLQADQKIPWSRIASLLGTQESTTSENQVLHAMILLNRGADQEREEAEAILKKVVYTTDRGTNDARRLLASYYQQRWRQSNQQSPESDTTRKWFTSAREHYRALANLGTPLPIDIYRFAELLLAAGELREANTLVNQLESISFASPLALEIRLRLATATGEDGQIEKLTERWADKNSDSDTGSNDSTTLSIAGQVLARLGFTEESVSWLGRAYEADARFLPLYAANLIKLGKFENVLRLCEEHYVKTKDPEALALLADAITLQRNLFPTPKTEETFAEAIRQHPDSPRLFEAIATLRLTNANYREAVRLFEHALSLAPDNVRILNNLAVALSELDARKGEALPVIRRAIEIAGERAELLDTLGIVLYRMGNNLDAVTAFRDAADLSNDTRYQFHLLMALLDSGNEPESLAIWSRLDTQQLKNSTLTPSERSALKKIEERFEE